MEAVTHLFYPQTKFLNTDFHLPIWLVSQITLTTLASQTLHASFFFFPPACVAVYVLLVYSKYAARDTREQASFAQAF